MVQGGVSYSYDSRDGGKWSVTWNRQCYVVNYSGPDCRHRETPLTPNSYATICDALHDINLLEAQHHLAGIDQGLRKT